MMLNELREFAIKGNVVDMAVGIIIGAAFTTIVNSLVDDILTPVIGWMTGDLDFSNQFWLLSEGDPPAPYDTVAEAEEAGAIVLGYGQLVNAIVSFILVAIALFAIVKWINQLRRHNTDPAPTTRPCPFCKSSIDNEASRCPNCTSEVEPVPV